LLLSGDKYWSKIWKMSKICFSRFAFVSKTGFPSGVSSGAVAAVSWFSVHESKYLYCHLFAEFMRAFLFPYQ
jgi:hypothetical protein